MTNPAPVIGSWYRKRGGETFEVVAIDPKDRTIEIQYFDGAVEELELEDWVEDDFFLAFLNGREKLAGYEQVSLITYE